MAVDEKITQITEGTAIADADLFPVVQNVSTTPVTRAKTGTLVKAWLKTYFDTLYGNPAGVIQTKYIITPSVASNNLTLALKYIDGNDPTSTNKLVFRVGNTEYNLTAAMSFTKNAGTSWANLGSAELAALPHDLFVYAIGETGGSAGLKFGFSRISYARTMGDFVNTSTSEKYIAGNWTNFNSTDAVTVIGRFRAQLSAGAGYTWSIPTAVVVNFPISETDWLDYTPAHFAGGGSYTNAPATNRAKYKLNREREMRIDVAFTYNATSGGTSYSRITLPFTPSADAIALSALNATAGSSCQAQTNSGYGYVYKYDGTSPIVNSNQIGVNGVIRI